MTSRGTDNQGHMERSECNVRGGSAALGTWRCFGRVLSSLVLKRKSALVGCILVTLGGGCLGTETGNGASNAQITACKSSDEFRPLPGYVVPGGGAELVDALEQREQHQTSSEPASVWLECVSWQTTDSSLSVLVSNLSGGCSVEYKGELKHRDQHELVLELKNPKCAVAACGSCSYDAQASRDMDADELSRPLYFKVQELDCHRKKGRSSSWILPLDERSHGTLCRPADEWAAQKAAGKAPENERNLYAPCGDPSDPVSTMSCADSLDCVEGHCVPPCQEASDCPLDGAFACAAGACQLQEAAQST